MKLCLDIGPGSQPIKEPRIDEQWSTVDLHKGYNPTYLADARTMKGVPRDHFDYIHSSHVIEHCDWYRITETLEVWKSCLKPGGYIDVWTVDATKCFKMLLEWDETGTIGDGNVSTWRHKLTDGDPYLYWVGKLLNYFKAGQNGDLNRHSSIFTRRRLPYELEKAGFVDVKPLSVDKDVRSHSHRMINHGVRGYRPK